MSARPFRNLKPPIDACKFRRGHSILISRSNMAPFNDQNTPFNDQNTPFNDQNTPFASPKRLQMFRYTPLGGETSNHPKCTPNVKPRYKMVYVMGHLLEPHDLHAQEEGGNQ